MSQTNTTWEINGHAFELDLQDADTVEKYENILTETVEREKKLPKDGKASEYIRAYYALMSETYDELFGSDSGKKILGEKANARIINEAWVTFLEFVNEQKTQAQTFKNSIMSKYSPNRAQRRA
jgi:hypothetical protein